MTFSVPLGGLRALSNQFLPDTCSVSRGTETSSGDGVATTWSTLATGILCRVSPQSSTANEGVGAAGGIQAVADWTIWLPAGQDVRVTDRIIFGSRVFEVLRVGARSYEVIRELLCQEVL